MTEPEKAIRDWRMSPLYADPMHGDDLAEWIEGLPDRAGEKALVSVETPDGKVYDALFAESVDGTITIHCGIGNG